MKKLIIISFVLLLSVCAKAQIQTNFWGLELSKSYSLYDAKNIISRNCRLVKIEGNNLYCSDGRFGGYDWNFIDFTFYVQGGTNRLYWVAFSQNFNSKEAAMDRFVLLRDALSNKYGEALDGDAEPTRVSKMWMFLEDVHVCNLVLEKSESKGGDIFWYVNLQYSNSDILSQTISNENEEL